MDGLPTPHNNLFQWTMSHLENARSLIETNFPQEVLSVLDLNTLQLEPVSFVDSSLRGKQSDLLLSAAMVDDTKTSSKSAKRVYVYFLFEHKSHSDPLTVLQVLSYIIRLWEHCARNGRPLYPVLPLVIHHGQTPWTAARRIEDLVPFPPELAPYQVRFGFPLLDLGQLPDDEIRGVPVLQSVLRLLKYGRMEQLRDELAAILRLLSAGLSRVELGECLKVFGVYIMAVNQHLSEDFVAEVVQSVFPTQVEPGSIADRLIRESLEKGLRTGREEGREEGREVGLEEGLMKGMLAAQIQNLQQLLGEPLSSPREFLACSEAELEQTLQALQARLRGRQSPE